MFDRAMILNTIHNEDCLSTMVNNIDPHSVDIVMTSPPYCTCNRAGKKSTATLKTETHSNPKCYPTARYDVFTDNLTEEEYVDWTVKLFENFDNILKENGCILYNISYSSTRRDMLFFTIAAIVERTNFSVMDMIVWKKKSALPNNTSSNKLTRIVEPVFVFARKNENDTFICNKKVTSVRERTGQKMYENVFNFVEAANNDGSNKLNKATYSSELCEKLLSLYGKSGMTVYDPFMGTGTTGVACKRLGMHYIGSELSAEQTKFALERISKDNGVPHLYNEDRSDGETSEEKPKKTVRKRRKTIVSETEVQKTNLEDRFKQVEMFDDGGNPNPEVFEKNDSPNEKTADGVTICGNDVNEKNSDEKVFSSKPLTAIEIELCDEFSDVDCNTIRNGIEKKDKIIYSATIPQTGECPVEDDEFE